MKISINISIAIFCLSYTEIFSAPTGSQSSRQGKSLAYLDYMQPEESEFQNFVDDPENDYANADYDENQLSRTLPTAPTRKKATSKPFNSPIYYIRLPPQPYMFVPGLGYVSQPSQPNPSSFLNVPVNFISNGKPGMIYQWNGGVNNFPVPSKPKRKPKPTPQPNSVVHRLPGKYVFNGRPNDIYVLGDTYNSLYNDALQSFYP